MGSSTPCIHLIPISVLKPKTPKKYFGTLKKSLLTHCKSCTLSAMTGNGNREHIEHIEKYVFQGISINQFQGDPGQEQAIVAWGSEELYSTELSTAAASRSAVLRRASIPSPCQSTVHILGLFLALVPEAMRLSLMNNLCLKTSYTLAGLTKRNEKPNASFLLTIQIRIPFHSIQ